MKPIKIVLISDTHERSVIVPPGDILVHAGDHTMMGTEYATERAAEWLRSQPHQHKIAVAGNHDWMFQNYPDAARELFEGIHYLEDFGIELMGLKFWGSPYTPEFYNWAFNVARDGSIKKHWDLIPSGLDLLITHGPPRGMLDQAAPHLNSERLGDSYLMKAVMNQKPRHHVFGHIHGGYGEGGIIGGTKFYNASVVDEAYRPVNAPIVIDVLPQ